ncbi:MAG: PilZ domain-containing protein [Candidatus Aminicenantales bacterium]
MDKFPFLDSSSKKNYEKGFELPLPCRVEGEDASGNRFKEKTTLSFISHQGSSFWLAQPVSIGSELRLVIDLPPALSEDKNLKLIIKGKVAFVEATNGKDSKQRISLHFDNKYIIKEED